MSKQDEPTYEQLVELILQYHDDMVRPPSEDSRKRRLEWINRVLDGALPHAYAVKP